MVTRNDIHEHLMAQYKKDSTHSTHNPTDTQCYRVTMVVLKLLATAAVLLALTPHWVDSTIISIPHGKGHALVKVGCSANWWGAIPTVNTSLPHPREVHVLHTVFTQSFTRFNVYCEQLGTIV